MSSDYNYDDQGQFFPFFILTISGLITLPLTYNILKPSTELKSTAPRIQTSFKPDDDELIQGQKKKQRRKERKLKRIIATILGYAVMAYMIYLIVVTQRTVAKLWDPYEILGISRSATEQEIKKQFRKLTLKFHPDKVQIDESKNQTLDEITDHYVDMSKAYKALTDEEVRNNYIQYGHPDGKQSFSIGIALPTFIVTEGNGKYVLGLYGGLLGVMLPWLVGRWWYGSQKLTKEKVLVQSAGNLFREWKEDLSKGGVIAALSAGEEYKQILAGGKADTGLGKVEKAVLDGQGALKVAGLSAKDKQVLAKSEGARRKALALLWAYIGRIKLGDSTLDDEKYEVAPQALALTDAMIAICLAYGNLIPLLNTLGASQNIIQAIPPGASPLLQLPHITAEIAAKIEGNDKVHMTVQQFMDIPEANRRRLVVEQTGALNQEQYNNVVAVARQIPSLRVEKAFFKCVGEKHIVTGSLVQFVVKARIIPPGAENVPEITEVDLEDIDADEDDLDGFLGRKPPKNSKGKGGEATKEEKEIAPPLAFAPYFARDHPPRWQMLLADMRQARVAVPPTAFTTFDKPIFNEDGKPTFNVQTLKIQFAAPPNAGTYSFAMHLVCDSYIAMDTRLDVNLVVEDQHKAAQIDEEEEISEPEEDSIAGQMNALKSGGVAQPKAPRRKKVVQAESDDESDTDGESDDTSDTDTDTDSDDD